MGPGRSHRDGEDDNGADDARPGSSRGARHAVEPPRPRRGCSSARTGSNPRRGERAGRGTCQSRGAGPARRAGAGPRAARRRRRSLYSRSTSAWEQAVISGLATRTRSTAGSPLRTFRRNASRSSRLARLRRTAPPSLRLTASPSRSWLHSLAAATRKKSGPSIRTPRRKARWNAAADRSRWGRRNRPPPSSGLGSDPLPSLLAAPLEDEATPLGPHPDQKPMGPLPLPVVRLERPLHMWAPFIRRSSGRAGLPVPGKAASLAATRGFCQTRGKTAPALPCPGRVPCDSLGCLEQRDLAQPFTEFRLRFPQVLKSLCKKGPGREDTRFDTGSLT